MPPGRLLTLADGIFAIAMTLLVLDLRLPDGSNADLATQLAGLRSAFLTFVISFVVLGVFWFAHHQTFHFLVRVNRTLVWLSIGFFLGVALIPFVASVLGAHPDDPIAFTLYGGAIGLLTVLGYVTWWYMTGDRGLVVDGMDPNLVRKVQHWIAVGPVIALVAIALAFVSPLASLLIYVALPVLFIAFNPVDTYLERLREKER
ncbi:MAG TPA: TMEM175 family protein [Thermoplasmata archaeon]|nr:TMEM175 family protein [Thermoplasmata archaeon]